MDGVCRRGRNASILARCRQSKIRHLRIVTSVNNVVRDSRVSGVLLKELIENGNGFSWIGQCWVLLRAGAEQRQRVKHSAFAIVWIVFVQRFHGRSVSIGALTMADLFRIAVERSQRTHVFALP